jgi:RNA polymerase sigma-70 factor (ECF subfamily)
MPSDDFEQIVSQHYEALYRFAFSLTHTEADACDLTQQTFYIWATKGHQLRDRSKVKSWLFTILHREFLHIRKRAVRFPHFELSEGNEELPTISPEIVNTLDAARALEFLGRVEEPYRAALNLFYLEDCSYNEIADILEVPLGTVRSRISRGKVQLQQLIFMGTDTTSSRAMRESDTTQPRSRKVGERPSADGVARGQNTHLTSVLEL